MAGLFLDKAKTRRLEADKVEAWGLKHRFASTVREVEGPEVERDANYQLHARVGGVWVRVWGWTRAQARPERALSPSALRMRRMRERAQEARIVGDAG